jgi:SsrA-binding protein
LSLNDENTDLVAVEIVNRKAKYEYEFLQTIEAGMQLTGSEVKSLRNGDANMGDAWCVFERGELYIRNLHIGEYKHSSTEVHVPLRMRKLLLHKAELKKLERRASEKGLTIVPYRIFFAESGFAKCEIVLARGKKSFDKRESIKEKDVQRDVDRMKVKR